MFSIAHTPRNGPLGGWCEGLAIQGASSCKDAAKDELSSTQAISQEWDKHFRNDHTPKWKCCCCPTPRPVFQTLRSFRAQLDEKHEARVSDYEDWVRVMTMSAYRSLGITNCPLCNEKGFRGCPLLIDHVFEHVYKFSMHALSWRTEPQANLQRSILAFDDGMSQPTQMTASMLPSVNAEIREVSSIRQP